MSVNGTIMVVEDDDDLRRMMESALKCHGYSVVSHSRGRQALHDLESIDVDAVVTDLRMPDMDGLELLARIRDAYPRVGTLLVTAYADLQCATEAIRIGVDDFLRKPFSVDVLHEAVARLEQRRRDLPPKKRLWQMPEAPSFREIVGSSAAMRDLVHQLQRISDSDCTVLITGESGTGKELVARSLHDHGPRQSMPFLAINCAALPPDLLESELFGHLKGSFTGASQNAMGLFAAASGGSLLLDEVGTLPLELQPKLLRVLQERTVKPLGGQSETRFDARLIAATNRDLDAAVTEGSFRRDLLFRLDVVRVHVPPLRERDQDVLELARHFLQKHCARSGRSVPVLTREAIERLTSYDWPGNVRELENYMQAALALANEGRIDAQHVPPHVRREAKPARTPESDLPLLETVEREHIARVLRAVGGNKAAAARILGINRVTLYRKLAQHGVSRTS